MKSKAASTCARGDVQKDTQDTPCLSLGNEYITSCRLLLFVFQKKKKKSKEEMAKMLTSVYDFA